MDIPFKLYIENHFNRMIEFKKFTQNFNLLLEEPNKYSLNIPENHDLGIFFQSKFDCYLEIDFMDILPGYCFTEEELEDDENFPCFYPNEKTRYLYLNTKSKKNHDEIEFPMLVPGCYTIKVTMENTEVYFALLEINPLRVESNQLEIMRHEIEDFLNGLAKEQRSSNVAQKMYPSYIHYQLDYFIKKHKKLIYTVQQVINNPKFELIRKYKFETKVKPGQTDINSIRHKQKRLDKHNENYIYKNIINYDIEENRMFKTIIKYLYKSIKICFTYQNEAIIRKNNELNEAISFKTNNFSLKRQIANKEKSYKILKRIEKQLILYLNSDHVYGVKNLSSINNPHKLVMVPFYSEIFKIYKEISKQKDIKDLPLVNYKYFWKESSKLYEVWAFIKIIEYLRSIDLRLIPISGWVFDSNDEILPFIDPDTLITFKNNEGLKVSLRYDSKILSDDKVTIDNPVYTFKRSNRPDIRMDIYFNEVYKNSIIGDFKYRDYKSLENFHKFTTRRSKRAVYNQLIDYSQIRSLFTGRDNNTKNNRSEEVAYETWVFYPTKMNERGKAGWDEETNIRRIELSPGKNTSFIGKLLYDKLLEIQNK